MSAFERRYARVLEHLARSEISERNKELLRSYQRTLVNEDSVPVKQNTTVP